MSYLVSRFAGSIAALALTTACGQAHAPGGADSGEADGGVTASDAGAPPAVDAGAPPEIACEALCRTRSSSITSGGCPFGTVPESGDCETRCAEFAVLSAASREAFEQCVLHDPLCFQSVDRCVYALRYPEPTEVPVRISGSGLSSHEGLTVVVAVEHAASRQTTRVHDGAFEVRFEPLVFVPGDPNAFGFIDVDGNGRCDADSDLVFFEYLERAGTFDAPAFSLDLEGPPRHLGFACDEF